MNLESNKLFMAFSAGKSSVESEKTFDKYIGIAPVTILAVNPTLVELMKLYNNENIKEPVYTNTVEINGEKGDSRTDGYGWSALDEVYWVDISHKEKLADGKYLLDFETGPSTTYLYSTLSSMGYDYDPDLEKPGV